MHKPHNETPTLEALRTASDELVIWCEPCRSWHRHGGGNGIGAGDGHRAAHCDDREGARPLVRSGYRLKESGPLTRDSQYRISGRHRPRGLHRQDYTHLVDR